MLLASLCSIFYLIVLISLPLYFLILLIIILIALKDRTNSSAFYKISEIFSIKLPLILILFFTIYSLFTPIKLEKNVPETAFSLIYILTDKTLKSIIIIFTLVTLRKIHEYD